MLILSFYLVTNDDFLRPSPATGLLRAGQRHRCTPTKTVVFDKYATAVDRGNERTFRLT
jgi:hypothetical protein